LPRLHECGIDAGRVRDPIGGLDQRRQQHVVAVGVQLTCGSPHFELRADRIDPRRIVRREVHPVAICAGRRVMSVDETGLARQSVESIERVPQVGAADPPARDGNCGGAATSTYARASTKPYSMMSDAAVANRHRFSARATLAVPLNGSTAAPGRIPRARSTRRMKSSSRVLLPM
jgi:hypothetical protein